MGQLIPLDYWGVVKPILERGYDAIHFQDHYYSYSIGAIALASRIRRTFFTAHDCLHFTGGCLYPMGCEKYLTGCGSCPQLGSIGKRDFTRIVWKSNHYYSQENIQYIYPSKWLLNKAEQTMSFRVKPALLPYGFDSGPYSPLSRSEARNLLGLHPSRPIVCVSSFHLGNRRKGARHSFAALRACAKLDPLVILLGNVPQGILAELRGLTYWMAGFVEDRKLMGRIYAASTLFLFSTLEDNLPISVQESMACGTPVVGFATGGVPEMIRSGLDGWLVSTGNQEALNRALHEALSDPRECELRGISAKQRLESRFSVSECIDSHISLYQSNGNT